MENYEIVRSKRKTIGLQILRDGRLLVRAPYHASDTVIQKVISEHETWIQSHRAAIAKENAELSQVRQLTREELQSLADQAVQVIPKRVAYYAPIVGVTYGRITIRNQRTRWGSCSAKGNLNFNCLLMLTPQEVIDSVVVHELCHRKYMNHSKQFYNEVLRVFPDYWNCDAWLKKHGTEIMRRMTG